MLLAVGPGRRDSGAEVVGAGRDEGESRGVKGVRVGVRGVILLLIIAVGIQILVVEMMLRRQGLWLPAIPWLVLLGASLIPSAFGGILLHLLIERARGLDHARSYLVQIRRPDWIATWCMLVFLSILIAFFYTLLKSSVPLLSTRSCDTACGRSTGPCSSAFHPVCCS